MKIGRLLLTNVTSYRRTTEFHFDQSLNILIGPNGGGKSNLQRIIAVVLTQFFVRQYQVRKADSGSVLEPSELYNKSVLASTLSKFAGDDGPQVIEIDLVPEESDVENIRAIENHLAKFNEHLTYYERRYDRFPPSAFVADIAQAKPFRYRIVDLKLEADSDSATTAKGAFRQYLQEFFIFMRVASKVPEATLTSPVFFFSSDRAFTRSFEVEAGQLTEDQHHNGYRTAFSAATGQTNMLMWGAQHFVRLFRRSQMRAGENRGNITEDFLRGEPDVQLLDRYLGRLGYKWEFTYDVDQTRFQFVLQREGLEIPTDFFSSGEREIVHFLLAMFALNVRGGIVLVDEPELHLHPRWQLIFLGLFRDLAPERRNQFIICTHSPVFVTPDTINSVARVYKGGIEGSKKVSLKEVSLPNKAKLVRMINSQNNERMFFADKVVLVEGPSDRLVFASLLEAAAARMGNNSALEVLDVGGKHNFDSYQSLLDGLQTPWVVIADLDYLAQVGSPSVKAMFQADSKRTTDAILDGKKGNDRASLISALHEAIESKDVEQLKHILTYIENRHRGLKDGRSPTYDALLESDRARLVSTGIITLDGEVEDYLPEGVSEIPEIVDCMSEPNWIIKVRDPAKRRHLAEIACIVLDVKEADRAELREALEGGEVVTPDPATGIQ